MSHNRRHPNPARLRRLKQDVADARRDVNWYERQVADAKRPDVKATAERALTSARGRLRDAEAALTRFNAENN